MTGPAVVIAMLTLGQTGNGPENPVYRVVNAEGLKVGETRVKLSPPVLNDGASAEEERAALVKIAGSTRAAEDLTRDSVTAPFVLKTHDEPVPGRGTIRVADLWFVVRARLDEIDPGMTAGATADGQTVEAANMKFTARLVDKDENRDAGSYSWTVHTTGRLLDRLHVEATDRACATKGEHSWVAASRTDPSFDADGTYPNVWYPVVRKAGVDEPGTKESYAGGVSYVKATALKTVAGGLLVESHFAFFEPRAWFDGAPILRSKIGVVAQDRVRGLRRSLAKSREAEGARNPRGAKGG